MLEVSHLYAGYMDKNILKNVTFSMERGEFLCILGANGCGKTTLLKTVLGIIKPSAGSVTLDGENIHMMDVKQLAKKIAYIPQAHMPPFPFTVREVVMMGRTPHLGYLSSPNSRDKQIVDDIINMLHISWMADTNYTKISGGQRQMVLIARALAQQPTLLMMDEPTASLDFGNQYTVLNKVIDLSENGMSVIMVTHDPSHASFCADSTLIVQSGSIVEQGRPCDVIREDSMQRIYHTRVKISEIEMDGGETTSICVPIHSKIINKKEM